jgi:hypothetical protein
MSTYVIIAALLLTVSLAAGLHVLRSVSKDPTVSRAEKVAAFLLAFVGWPFVLTAILAVFVTCWDVMFWSDSDIDPLDGSPRRNL